MSYQKTVEKILSSGISLADQGINNFVFSKENALTLLDELKREGIGVLGGDVYVLSGQQYKPSYDNWCCDRWSQESREDFVARSINKAREYVVAYRPVENKQAMFAFVVPDDVYYYIYF
jgi:hypothetical protein